ncbi:hypothetical protein JCGZ_10721 [Jatropha curcas]|uniref:Uncharacterized protein n=1 Tax=Jatropha curcas TaxID=180498 RepID=A0A067KGE7_JATCU|nr:hypothetical protein JCGZ_10721 [Jatropha curcas]
MTVGARLQNVGNLKVKADDTTVSSEMESRLARDSHASPKSETNKEREKLAVDEGEDWNRSVVTRSPENQWRVATQLPDRTNRRLPATAALARDNRGEGEKERHGAFRFDSNRFDLIQRYGSICLVFEKSNWFMGPI